MSKWKCEECKLPCYLDSCESSIPTDCIFGSGHNANWILSNEESREELSEKCKELEKKVESLNKFTDQMNERFLSNNELPVLTFEGERIIDHFKKFNERLDHIEGLKKPEPDKPLPCPFCGNERILYQGLSNNHSYQCIHCGVRTIGRPPTKSNKKLALKEWNNREPLIDV